jgi:hypothetical protein
LDLYVYAFFIIDQLLLFYLELFEGGNLMKNSFGKVVKVGKALMLPVAVLPIAALLLRLGAGDVFDLPFMYEAGNAIFAN